MRKEAFFSPDPEPDPGADDEEAPDDARGCDPVGEPEELAEDDDD